MPEQSVVKTEYGYIVDGSKDILLIAPHACLRNGRTKNDENTGPICWMEMNDYQQALSDLNEAVEIDDEGNGILDDIDVHIQEAKNKMAEATA